MCACPTEIVALTWCSATVRVRGEGLGIEPGDDEGAVADFLDFAHNSAGEIVRVECTEFNSPGKWPVVARFVVETRPDDGAVEIVHWRVERVRQG